MDFQAYLPAACSTLLFPVKSSGYRWTTDCAGMEQLRRVSRVVHALLEFVAPSKEDRSYGGWLEKDGQGTALISGAVMSSLII